MDLNRLPIERIKIPAAMDLHKELVRLKRTSLRWLGEISKCVAQESLRDLDRAFRNLWEHGYGFPKFKSKKWAKKSFRITGDKIAVADDAIRLPKVGWIKLKEDGYLLPEGAVHILSATVSERASCWFVSLNVIEDFDVPENRGTRIGIDAGLTSLLTIFDGKEHTHIENPKALIHHEGKLRRLHRAVSRKMKGSSNRRKAVLKLQKEHLKVANIRKDALNKATTTLAKTNSVIVIEILGVRGMMKNHHLAQAFADAALAEAVRQLEYKTVWYGSRLVKAQRFYPSTKQCSNCGYAKDEMALSEHIFRCERCGLVAQRDDNASTNLYWYELRMAVGSTASKRLPESGRLQAERPVPGGEAGKNYVDLTCPRLSA